MDTPQTIIFQGHPEPTQLDILDATIAGHTIGRRGVRVVHTGAKFNTAERESTAHLADGFAVFKDRLQQRGVSYNRLSTPNVPGCTMDIINLAVAQIKKILDVSRVRDLRSAQHLMQAVQNVHTADGYRVGKAKMLIQKDVLSGLTAALSKAETRDEFKTFVARVRETIAGIKVLAAKPEFVKHYELSHDALCAWEQGVCEILGRSEVPYDEFLGKKAYGMFGVKKRDWDDLHAILKGTEHGILHFELFIKMMSIRGLSFVAVDILDIGAAMSDAALTWHQDEKSTPEDRIKASLMGMHNLCEGKSNVTVLQLGDGETDDLFSGILVAGSRKCNLLVFVLPLPSNSDDLRIVTTYATTLCELFSALGQRFRVYYSQDACNLEGVKRAARLICNA